MTTFPSEGFTCMDCLRAEAVIYVHTDDGGEWHVCGSCVDKAVADRLLDHVIAGDLIVGDNGEFHRPV